MEEEEEEEEEEEGKLIINLERAVQERMERPARGQAAFTLVEEPAPH